MRSKKRYLISFARYSIPSLFLFGIPRSTKRLFVRIMSIFRARGFYGSLLASGVRAGKFFEDCLMKILIMARILSFMGRIRDWFSQIAMMMMMRMMEGS